MTNTNIDEKVEESVLPHKFQGLMSILGKLELGVAMALTAGTTQTQVGGTPLSKTVNFVKVCANSSDGVRLPVASEGRIILLVNDGAAALKVWPATDGTIHEGSVDAADGTLVPINEGRIYVGEDALNWESVSLGDVGA